MKKALIILLACLGGLAVLALGAAAVCLLFWEGESSVPAKTILEADFEQGIAELAPEDPVGSLIHGKAPVMVDVVQGLDRAATDDRVKGLVARIGTAPMGLARVQELRDAVLAFRQSGKPAIAWAETFGEFGPGNSAYYLATAFDEIWLQPSGDIGLTGFIAETPFLRGTLDKLGVVPRMDHRYEYKNAMNIFTEKGYTAPHREATLALLEGEIAQVVRGIADARGMSESEVRATIDRGPYLGAEAVDAKLVDGMAYRDEVLEKVRAKVGADADLLYLSKYLDRGGRSWNKGDTIALVYGVGGVTRGKSGYDALTGEYTMGSDSVSSAIRAAAEDGKVKAIIFRVDSPGGSYVASDTVWREVSRARAKGKPVVVSMGDVAASGGYFVSMNADKIVAQPGTITGSIGVLAGKMFTDGLWEKTGLYWDEVHSGQNATMWTGSVDYSPEQWARFEAWLDRIYADFTTKVSEGRKLPKERVLEIARGRVWIGEEAKRLGLVDDLGGYPAALKLAKEAAGLAPDGRVKLRVFPRPKSPWESLVDQGPDSSESKSAAAIGGALERLRPLVRGLQAAGVFGPPPGPIALPPEAIPALN